MWSLRSPSLRTAHSSKPLTLGDASDSARVEIWISEWYKINCSRLLVF